MAAEYQSEPILDNEGREVILDPDWRKKRMDWFKNSPGLTYLDKGVQCDEMRWSHMPLKAIYGKDEEERRAAWEKHRCRAPAKWKLKAKRPGRKTRANRNRRDEARSGTYCWQHMINQITYNLTELERMMDYEKEHPPDWFVKIDMDNASGSD